MKLEFVRLINNALDNDKANPQRHLIPIISDDLPFPYQMMFLDVYGRPEYSACVKHPVLPNLDKYVEYLKSNINKYADSKLKELKELI